MVRALWKKLVAVSRRKVQKSPAKLGVEDGEQPEISFGHIELEMPKEVLFRLELALEEPFT